MDNKHDDREVISRGSLEKALWQLTGWQGDQVVIDGIMLVHDAVVATDAEALAHSPESFRDGYYHALVCLAGEILDSGGRMRLVPPGAEPVLRAGDVDALAEAILAKLPEAARRAEDERLLADPDLAESLEQMRAGQGFTPGRKEIEAIADDFREGEYTGDITCTACGVSKPAADFYRDSKGRHGRKSRCKSCEQDRKRAAAA